MKPVSAFFLLCIVLGLCSSALGESASTPLIDVIYSGGKGDHSFIDSAYRGLLQAKENLTFDVQEFSIYNASSDPVPEISGPDGETPVMVLLVGSPLTGMAQTIATANPAVPVIGVDTDPLTGNNTRTIRFSMYGSSYLAGIIAADQTSTGKIAIVAGRKSPVLDEFIAGFSEGANQSEKDVTLTTAYVADDNSGFWSPDKAAAIARNLSTNGTDIIYTVAGGSGTGVIDLARNTTGLRIIGVDSDQSVLGPEVVIASVVKNLDQVVTREITAVMQGSFTPGTVVTGLADNGSGILINPRFSNCSPLISGRYQEAITAEKQYD